MGKVIDVASIQSDIASLLHFSTFEPEQRFWLDTGSPDFNAVLGSRDFGLPYGKLYEISGMEHGGKTTISTVLAGMAQNDDAGVGYIDAEDSRDEAWAVRLGLDWNNVVPIYSKLIHPKSVKAAQEIHKKIAKKQTKAGMLIPRLQGAEELFAEAEVAMAKLYKLGFEKQFWMVDSVANLQTIAQGEAGTSGQNMRTKVDRAMFLSDVLPRWAGLAANYNAMVFFINQLREKVGLVFGDPTYTPGGRALRHNCSIRARVKRHKNGRILQNKKVIGISSIITNYKNKSGNGSVEGCSCAFRIKWNTNPAKIQFMPVSEMEEM